MWRNLIIVFVLVLVNICSGFFFPTSPSENGIASVKKTVRWNLPWLGMGMWCNGCPPSSCEEDEAIIHGYCCGCAKAMDHLPVLCPQFLQCPLNAHGLCHDYEYMMRCCC